MKLKKRLGCSFSMFRPMRPLSTRRSTHRLQIDYFLFDRHRQTTVGSEEQDTNSLIPALVIHAAIYYSSAIVVAIVIRLLCWQPNHRSRPTGNFLIFFSPACPLTVSDCRPFTSLAIDICRAGPFIGKSFLQHPFKLKLKGTDQRRKKKCHRLGIWMWEHLLSFTTSICCHRYVLFAAAALTQQEKRETSGRIGQLEPLARVHLPMKEKSKEKITRKRNNLIAAHFGYPPPLPHPLTNEPVTPTSQVLTSSRPLKPFTDECANCLRRG